MAVGGVKKKALCCVSRCSSVVLGFFSHTSHARKPHLGYCEAWITKPHYYTPVINHAVITGRSELGVITRREYLILEPANAGKE